MKNLFRKNKAVSPVVATILLIALTVSAAAIVYFVVVPMLRTDSEINFNISEINQFTDYDHDGSIDAIKVNIVIATSTEPGLVNMSEFNYEIISGSETYQWLHTEAGMTSITVGSDGEVVISAWSDSGELTEGEQYTLRVFLGSNEDSYTFTAGTAILGPMVTVNVIDLDSDPVPGADVEFYYSNGAYTGKSQGTNPEGYVEMALKIGEYRAKVSYFGETYWSEYFYHPKVSTVTVTVGSLSARMVVHVRSGSEGVVGVPVFSFDEFGRYAGSYATTDNNGDAYLAIDPGTYVFMALYNGFNYSSPQIEYPAVEETTIDMGGGKVFAHVIDSDGVGQYNLRVYVFSNTGSYLGLSARTNETGYAEFTLSAGGYKFRVDYSGTQSWSVVFGASDGAVIPIYIGGKVYAHVVYGPDDEPLSNVRVYLFTASHSYTGISARTNETGYALFSPVPKVTTFVFRVDYAGGQFWSNEFTGDAALTIVEINIGGEVYAHVMYGSGDTPLANVRVYLFTDSGSYTGLSARTNETGYARFNGVLGGLNYKFRVDYAGGQYWSITFIGNSSQMDVVDINIGGTVFAKVMYGPFDEILANVQVYLFTSTHSYTGLSARTNTTGYAQFDGVLSTTTYTFRVDYAGGQYWSDFFDGSIDNYVEEINIGGIVNAHVIYGPDNDPLANVRVYLFTASLSYTGISNRTDALGYAQFNGVLSNTQYVFRVDYAGGQFWSTEFNGSQPTYTHDIYIGGIVFAQVVYGADNDPLDNVQVYLFTASHSYTGLSVRTNETGHAQFDGVLSNTQYVFRVDYAGGQFWSDEFNGSLPVYTHVVNIGSRVYCYVYKDGSPQPDAQVYLFTENNVYTGLTIKTNSTGYATFNGTLSTLNYKFRVNYGSEYWSAVFSGALDGHIETVDVS